jgi:hypothetical protein
VLDARVVPSSQSIVIVRVDEGGSQELGCHSFRDSLFTGVGMDDSFFGVLPFSLRGKSALGIMIIFSA